MADTTFSTDTSHASVRIERHGDQLQLKFASDTQAIQSCIDLHQPHRLVMENLRYLMGILMFLPEPQRILLLGVGGGALVHFLRYYLPEADITAVDYDAELLAVAHEHLELPRKDDRLHYAVADAREYLEHSRKQFDLIVVDIFDSGRTPGWLTTPQTIELFRSGLSDRGGIAYNLLMSGERDFSAFYRHLRRAYTRQTLCLETEDYENLLVYGLNFRLEQQDMTHWLQHCLPLSERYGLPFAQILQVIYNINPAGSGII